MTAMLELRSSCERTMRDVVLRMKIYHASQCAIRVIHSLSCRQVPDWQLRRVYYSLPFSGREKLWDVIVREYRLSEVELTTDLRQGLLHYIMVLIRANKSSKRRNILKSFIYRITTYPHRQVSTYNVHQFINKVFAKKVGTR